MVDGIDSKGQTSTRSVVDVCRPRNVSRGINRALNGEFNKIEIIIYD